MSDQSLLFHNPETLSDGDLSIVKGRMRVQRYMGWMSAGILGFSMFAYDLGIRRASFCWLRVALATVAGFGLTGLASHKITWTKKRLFSQPAVDQMDDELLCSMDKKFAEKAMNASGYGNNSLRAAIHMTHSNIHSRKPY